MERLTPCAGWFEVDHGLHREGLLSVERREVSVDAGIDHVIKCDFVAPMGLQQTRISLERVFVLGVHPALGPAVAATLNHVGEVLGPEIALFIGEQISNDEEALRPVHRNIFF